MKILVGRETGDHVSLTVHGWSVEQPENPVDAAWLATDVEVEAGAFRGVYPAQLHREDLASWHDQIATLDREFTAGAAIFSPSLEPSIDLVISVGNTGNLTVSGAAVYGVGSSSQQRLEFNFPVEQSVRQLLSHVEAVLRDYPDRTPRLEMRGP